MTGEADDRRIRNARVDWDASAPRSIFFDDVYFSGDGPAETQHVFLDGNRLPARFERAERVAIGELGFGTGLNFLVTADAWRNGRKLPNARLEFLSIEAFPLATQDMARAQAAWPQLADLAARMRQLLPPPTPGLHRIRFDSDLALTLAYGDAHEALARTEGAFDAWYFDGFAPRKNPQMWRSEIFEEVARLSGAETTFATYTVAGEVRHLLQSVGFEVEKISGFGRKREMLRGILRHPPPRRSKRAPWHAPSQRRASLGARIAIIGGGIAGASVAHEAAAAGLEPVILDSAGLAAGASGNPAGLIMPRLDAGSAVCAQFFAAAYLHTIRKLSMFPDIFNSCGVLLLATTPEEEARHRKLLASPLIPEGWIEQHDRGLFFPQAGVVDPALWVKALAGDAPVLRRKVRRLHAGSPAAVEYDDGCRDVFDIVVIANGADAHQFVQSRSLPLSGVAGQIDWFPAASPYRHATAFGAYIAPSPDGGTVIGATYEPPEPRTRSMEAAATLSNIRAVGMQMPAAAALLDPAQSRTRSSVRCQTPDRLPLAGPMPDWNFYGSAYDDLRFGRSRAYPQAEAIEGVYILSGLGSRGLVTAPICAAALLAEIAGVISPLAHDIAEAIHPARFFIRDLKRAQIRRKR